MSAWGYEQESVHLRHSPPQMTTEAGGTHPTRMHSCYYMSWGFLRLWLNRSEQHRKALESLFFLPFKNRLNAFLGDDDKNCVFNGTREQGLNGTLILVRDGIYRVPLGLENLEKWKDIFQSGKSRNFEQTGKVRENHTKYWKNEKISHKYYLIFLAIFKLTVYYLLK